MSATQKLPLIAGITGAGASFAVAALPAIRAYVSRILGIHAPGGLWRALFFLLALLNLKNLPFMWHFRVFLGIRYQLYRQPTPIPPTALFEPVITSTRTPIAEIDYNMHKSNATYFTDLDISRTHLVAAIFRRGILAANKAGKNPEGGRAGMAFGGVTCHFKREILPYKKYEIWTRLLSWDRKWIYLVSHFVEAGVVKPRKYTLQPWKKGRSVDASKNESEAEYKERLQKAVFASSISKYVVKRGRITVPADIALERSGMLPPRPSTDSHTSANGAATLANGSATTANGSAVAPEILEESVLSAIGEDWTWEKVEAERLRGLRFAEMFSGLDGLHGEFDGGEHGALGEYADMLW